MAGKTSKPVKPWRCKCGAVMGAVYRNGSGVRQLMVFRTPIPDGEEMPPEVDVSVVVEGAATVRCELCGASRVWVPGEEALREMLARMGHGLEVRKPVEVA